MARWKRRFQEAATDLLRLPADALVDVSRVTCLDAAKIIIENAVELRHVSDGLIDVAFSEKLLSIEGSNFIVTFISNREIHVEGNITQLRYQPRDDVMQ